MMLYHAGSELLQNGNKYFHASRIYHSLIRKFIPSDDKFEFLEILVAILQQFLTSMVEHHSNTAR